MNLYIDIAISLILIFLVFSVIVYVLQELVAVNLQYRGKMLWRSLAQAIDGAALNGKRALDRTGLVAGASTHFTDLLFNHPQLQSLKKDADTFASYIPSANFANALIDMVAQNAPAPSGNTLTDFQTGLGILAAKYLNVARTFLPPPVAPAPAAAPSNAPPILNILQSIAKTSATLDDLQKNIEKWYNDYMNRVTGWYQTHTLLTIRLLAFGVTLFFNLNCIRLAVDIANNSVLRGNLVGIAERVTDHPEIVTGLYERQFKTAADSIAKRYQDKIILSKNDSLAILSLKQKQDSEVTAKAEKYSQLRIKGVRDLTDSLSAIHLPMGWKWTQFTNWWAEVRDPKHYSLPWVGNLLLILLGWLITAGCLSMGAPFWFNLLIQLVNVRRAGVKPKGDKKK